MTGEIVGENEQAGSVIISIDVSDLPEGTEAVRLSDGEIVEIAGEDQCAA